MGKLGKDVPEERGPEEGDSEMSPPTAQLTRLAPGVQASSEHWSQ